MKKIKTLTAFTFIFIAAFCVFCISVFAETQSLQETKTAYAPYGSPIVDGYYDEIWNNSDRLYFVYDRQGCSVDNLAEKHEYENEDVRNWVKVMWDEDFLYLFYYFYDTDLHFEDTIAEYNRDGVEFYVDEYNDKAATKAESKAMYQIGICMTEGYADYANSYVDCYVISEGNDHFVELKYEFKELKPIGGEIIGFDASVNVNNTGENVRDHCLSWNDRTNTTYKYPLYMGDCVLLPKDHIDDFEYIVDKDENGNEYAIVTEYKGNAERVTVPMMLGGKYVLAVAEGAFDGDTNLKQLTLPLTVILFGDINVPTLENVFVNEDNLIYYTENGVVFSKNNNYLVMFPCAYPYSIYSVPSHVVNIYPGAFNGAKNLESIILPDGLVNIYSDNFSNCEALADLEIPKSVRIIEENVGASCKNLESVSLLSKDISIGDGFLSNSPVKLVELYKDNNFEDKLVGSYHKIYLGENAKVRVSSANALAGETFSVDILIENNVGISGMRFVLEYDREIIELVDVSYDNSFWKGTCNFQDELPEYPYEFVYYSANDTTENGIIATLTFKVADAARPGETEIALEFTDDVINSELQKVDFEAENAVIKIGGTILGDVNNDGEVNIKDVVLLSQYLAGWHLEIASYASDCNNDGSTNIKDIVILVQYLSGWEVELG